MFNSTSTLLNFANPQGLYRVWIRANEAQDAPLVSIWIDPEMRAFEPQGERSVRVARRGRARLPDRRRGRKDAKLATFTHLDGYDCRSPLHVLDSTCMVTICREDSWDGEGPDERSHPRRDCGSGQHRYISKAVREN